MGVWQQSRVNKKGFTIVELIVVIAVIAILATISIVGYGSWRSTTAQNTVKSDLNAVASAMSNYLTFNNTYPTTAATFSSIVTASKNVTLTPTSLSTTAYCVDGVSSDSPSNPYYISSATKDQGATAGTCASVSAPTSAPGVPTGLAGTGFSTNVTLSWSAAVSGGTAASYSAQCSSDAAFITNVGQATTTNTSVTVGGLVSSTTQYCRVQASNSVGNSAWTSIVTVNTSTLQPPTGLALSSATISSITLSWNTNPDAASYTVQCTTDSTFNSGILSSSVATPALTTQFSSLPFNTTYYCRVNTVAANSATSGWSSPVTVSTSNFLPPAGFTATSTTFTTISVSWTANAIATSYNLQCSTNSSFSSIFAAFSVSSPTVTGQFNGMTPNTTFYCRINSSAQGQTSGWSSTLTTATTNNYGSLAIGTSIEGSWTTAPTGYLLEDGSAVSRTQYAALFAVIGTYYGAGDGSTTFNLPDSRGRTPVNQNPSDAEFNTIGEKYGSKTDVQTVAQLPSHTHIQNPQTYTLPFYPSGSEAAGYGMYGSGSFQNRAYVTGCCTNLSTTTSTNQSTGGSVAHNIIQPSIVRTFAIKYAAIDASAPTLPAGTSIQGYWSSAPTGYLPEDGSAVSRTTYATLFAAIGTTYGAGDGSTTFNVPDSRGRAGVNLSYTDAEFNTMGEKYGEKTHTMTVAEMPSHTHIQNANSHTIYSYTSGTEAAGYGMNAGGGFVNRVIVNGSATTMSTSTDTATNQYTGGNTGENVIQPSIVQLSAIKYTAATGFGNAVATGTTVSTYTSAVPSGFLAEDGSAVSRTTYAALFATIGTTYGAGDGSTTFNVPDSRGRVGVNISPSDAEFNTIGEKYGEKTHLMTIAEMASHSHTQNADTPNVGIYPSGSEASGYGLVSGGAGFGNRVMVTGGGTATNSVTATNQSTGGGQAFNVIQPSIVKLFAIKY